MAATAVEDASTSGDTSSQGPADMDPARAETNWKRPGLALGVLFALYLFWHVTHLGGAGNQVLIGNLVNEPFCLFALWATLRAARRCRSVRRWARSWRLLAAANVCTFIGQALQAYEEANHHQLPYPSVADAAYLSFYFCFFAGLVGLARGARGSTRRIMFGLDAVTVTLGASAVLWYLDAGPSALAGGQRWPVVVLAVAYPVGDLLLVLGAAAALLQNQPSLKRPLALTAAGVILYVLGDLIWSQILIHGGSYQGGDWLDAAWTAATALYTLGAVLQPVLPSSGPAPMATTTVVSRRASWAPYGAIVATFALLLVAEREDSVLPLSITVIAVAVALVVGARQLLAQLALADEQARNRVLVEQLRHQAFHDVLTGIANRAQLNVELGHLLTPVAGSGRYQAIFMIDLDGFKAINDKFGHDVGDQVLIAVAERLQKGLRHGDTAARLGGDEFVVLADNLSGPTTAVAIGERILEALSTPIELAVGALVPGASIGVAVSSESSASAEVLLREADSALYEAKRTGRGRAVLSSPQYVLQ
jgi:diguanylate cyclase (GGDEF)-like protein